jgi:spermidine synthase
LIGHGAGELTEELLKEPVKRIDYVELDPAIVTMTENYLPESYYKALEDSRVSIKNTDGRFFVKNTPDKYDCVIVRVGDPYTAQINRYYTVEFFDEVKRVLKEGGILSLALGSSESYISAPLGELLSSIYLSLKDVFSACLVIPGDTAYFIASDKSGYMTVDHNILEERVRERS